ncbi:MAG: hypothetical protein AAF182_01215, partial [Pseudomonadota bacterium]
TTEAALKLMMKGDLMGGAVGNLPEGWKLVEGIKAARDRGEEIGKEQLAAIGLSNNDKQSPQETLEA